MYTSIQLPVTDTPVINTIDLRSDTITRPTPGMLQAMFTAAVGDDVYEEDPTVNELEKRRHVSLGWKPVCFAHPAQ